MSSKPINHSEDSHSCEVCSKAREILTKTYSRVLIPYEGGVSAKMLEFPGCFAEGNTPDEAFKNLESAAFSWVLACLETGQEIPEPNHKPRSILRKIQQKDVAKALGADLVYSAKAPLDPFGARQVLQSIVKGDADDSSNKG